MKKIVTTILCDACNKDISPQETSYPRIDVLKLSCENVALSTGITYAISQIPLIENDLFFCSFKCLKVFIN